MFQVSYDEVLILLGHHLIELHKNEQIDREISSKKENIQGIIEQLNAAGYASEDQDLIKDIRKGLNLYREVVVRADGNVKNNHNPENRIMAIAYIIQGDNETVAARSELLGNEFKIPTLLYETINTTPSLKTLEPNNTVAEYAAIIRSLEFLLKRNYVTERVIVLTDSKSVVEQVYSQSMPKKIRFVLLKNYVLFLAGKFPEFELRYVPRKENSEAHKLARQLLKLD